MLILLNLVVSEDQKKRDEKDKKRRDTPYL